MVEVVKNPDKAVKATLRDPDVAGAAILSWAVKGCLDWQRDGLQIPAIVTDATVELRDEMNPLQEFFAVSCEFGPEYWTSAKELREAYEGWGEESGERYLVRGKEWGRRLRAKGCEASRQRVGKKLTRGWTGIQLSEECDTVTSCDVNVIKVPRGGSTNIVSSKQVSHSVTMSQNMTPKGKKEGKSESRIVNLDDLAYGKETIKPNEKIELDDGDTIPF